jgi:hypothetical protein
MGVAQQDIAIAPIHVIGGLANRLEKDIMLYSRSMPLWQNSLGG